MGGNTVGNALAHRTVKGADGRTRYHGQLSRGAPSSAAQDAWDLEDAAKHIEKARNALAIVATPEVQQLPRIQRDAAKRAALSLVDLARRFMVAVLGRGKYNEEMVEAAREPRE